MPDYEVQDAQGRKLMMSGDAPPTEADIDAAFKVSFPASPSSSSQSEQPQTWLDSAKAFGSGVMSQVNPIEMLKGVYGAITSPIETAKGVSRAQLDQFKQGKQAFDEGRYWEAYGHTMAGVMPLVGPAAAGIGEDIGQGNVAHGLGATAGLLGTIEAPKAGKAISQGLKATIGESVAATAERAGNARMVDAIAPQVGPNKLRFGNMAKQVAPRLAAEPGLSAGSRVGLAEKIGAKLSDAEAMLDAANDARAPTDLVDTGTVAFQLEQKLRQIAAQPAEGAGAHEAASRAGYKPTLPDKAPIAQKFSELPPTYQGEVKRLLAEMEEFPYVDRTPIDTTREYAREGGNGVGRGARNQQSKLNSKPFTEASGGTPIYQEILEGKGGTTRNAMIRSMQSYINEDKLPTSLVQRVVNLADKRIRTPEAVSKPMLPLEDFLPVQEGPLGESVIPKPMQDRADQIVQALRDVRKLGPMAPYESVRKIRQAYDIPARQKYVPSLTQDFLKKQGEASGAADVTGVLRDAMAVSDPRTAIANKEYAFWRKAHDVVEAANEVERVRPTVGRKIMARLGGAMVGGATGGTLGEVLGFSLGPLIDSVASSASQGRKIMTARLLSDVASALRSGDVQKIETVLRRARAFSLTTQAMGKAQ